MYGSLEKKTFETKHTHTTTHTTTDEWHDWITDYWTPFNAIIDHSTT